MYSASIWIGFLLTVAEQVEPATQPRSEAQLVQKIIEAWQRQGAAVRNIRVRLEWTSEDRDPGGDEQLRKGEAEVAIRYPYVLVRNVEHEHSGGGLTETIVFDGTRPHRLLRYRLERYVRDGVVLELYPPLEQLRKAGHTLYPFAASRVMAALLIGPEFDRFAWSWRGVATTALLSAVREQWEGEPAIKVSYRRDERLPESYVWVSEEEPYRILAIMTRGRSGNEPVVLGVTTYKWDSSKQWPDGLIGFEDKGTFSLTTGTVREIALGVVGADDVQPPASPEPGTVVREHGDDYTVKNEELVLPNGERIPVDMLPPGFLARYHQGQAELTDLVREPGIRSLIAVGLAAAVAAASLFAVFWWRRRARA